MMGDSTDKYLHTRRKAISKAIAKDKNEAYDIGKTMHNILWM